MKRQTFDQWSVSAINTTSADVLKPPVCAMMFVVAQRQTKVVESIQDFKSLRE